MNPVIKRHKSDLLNFRRGKCHHSGMLGGAAVGRANQAIAGNPKLEARASDGDYIGPLFPRKNVLNKTFVCIINVNG